MSHDFKENDFFFISSIINFRQYIRSYSLQALKHKSQQEEQQQGKNLLKWCDILRDQQLANTPYHYTLIEQNNNTTCYFKRVAIS